MSKRPMIVAHRGLHHEFPENSVESFAAAFNAGIEAIEFDVRQTADRVPIIIHDDSLDRMTTAKGHVAASTWEQLSQSRLKFRDAATEIPIPRLADVFSIADPKRTFIVELKDHDRELTRFVVQNRRKFAGSVIVQSFKEETVADAFAIDPSCDLALLCGDKKLLPAAIESRWKRLNLSHTLLTKKLVDDLRSAGRIVGAWTTNTEVEIRGVMSLGVDCVITDEPILARQIADEMYPR